MLKISLSSPLQHSCHHGTTARLGSLLANSSNRCTWGSFLCLPGSMQQSLPSPSQLYSSVARLSGGNLESVVQHTGSCVQSICWVPIIMSSCRSVCTSVPLYLSVKPVFLSHWVWAKSAFELTIMGILIVVVYICVHVELLSWVYHVLIIWNKLIVWDHVLMIRRILLREHKLLLIV